jgi:peptidoglycan/LPS O-acetylase OafA/YrhL
LVEFFENKVFSFFKKFARVRSPFILLCIVFFAAAISTTLSKTLWIVTDPLFGISFTFLIAAIILPKLGASDGEPPQLFSRMFIKLGMISYSFYLIHSQFGWLITAFVPSQMGAIMPFIIRIGFLLISLIPIYIFFKWFESPFLYKPKPESKLYPVYNKVEKLFGVR